MKEKIKKLINLTIRPCILFESKPDFSGNTMAVFNEMVGRKMYKKYELLWLLEDRSYKRYTKRGLESVSPYRTKTLKERLFNLSFNNTAFIIYENVYPNIFSDKPNSFYLTHGTPIKNVRGYYHEGKYADTILAASENVKELAKYQFEVEKGNAVGLGFPRNDAFFGKKHSISKLFGFQDCKVVVWYPTYRQRKDGMKAGGDIGIPLLYNDDEVKKLDQYAKEHNIVLVIKPHFVQDMNYVQQYNFEHIRIINDNFFNENGITSYEFLGSSDALITDYSSVYYDYTLCDKPIAVVWDDIEDYRKFPGFAVELDETMSGAEKIFNIQDLYGFLKEVSIGVDRLQDNRRVIRDFYNYAADGNNTKRVVDFIEKELKRI